MELSKRGGNFFKVTHAELLAGLALIPRPEWVNGCSNPANQTSVSREGGGAPMLAYRVPVEMLGSFTKSMRAIMATEQHPELDYPNDTIGLATLKQIWAENRAAAQQALAQASSHTLNK